MGVRHPVNQILIQHWFLPLQLQRPVYWERQHAARRLGDPITLLRKFERRLTPTAVHHRPGLIACARCPLCVRKATARVGSSSILRAW